MWYLKLIRCFLASFLAFSSDCEVFSKRLLSPKLSESSFNSSSSCDLMFKSLDVSRTSYSVWSRSLPLWISTLIRGVFSFVTFMCLLEPVGRERNLRTLQSEFEWLVFVKGTDLIDSRSSSPTYTADLNCDFLVVGYRLGGCVSGLKSVRVSGDKVELPTESSETFDLKVGPYNDCYVVILVSIVWTLREFSWNFCLATSPLVFALTFPNLFCWNRSLSTAKFLLNTLTLAFIKHSLR